MSKRNRERKDRNRERLRDLGLAGSNLGRTQKRQLLREMSNVPTVAEIREQAAAYSAASIIAGLGLQTSLDSFLVSRLVHEAALSSGGTPFARTNWRRLAGA